VKALPRSTWIFSEEEEKDCVRTAFTDRLMLRTFAALLLSMTEDQDVTLTNHTGTASGARVAVWNREASELPSPGLRGARIGLESHLQTESIVSTL
jgi:hypothetical protein